MDEIPAERRLVAILAADIVGYSRLIEEDEAATLTAIRTLRHEALDPLLAQHHGRIVKLTGDGAIVEFGLGRRCGQHRGGHPTGDRCTAVRSSAGSVVLSSGWASI